MRIACAPCSCPPERVPAPGGVCPCWTYAGTYASNQRMAASCFRLRTTIASSCGRCGIMRCSRPWRDTKDGSCVRTSLMMASTSQLQLWTVHGSCGLEVSPSWALPQCGGLRKGFETSRATPMPHACYTRTCTVGVPCRFTEAVRQAPFHSVP